MAAVSFLCGSDAHVIDPAYQILRVIKIKIFKIPSKIEDLIAKVN